MLAVLAGVVHNRQRADDYEHDEDNDYRGLHSGLASLSPFRFLSSEKSVSLVGELVTARQ